MALEGYRARNGSQNHDVIISVLRTPYSITWLLDEDLSEADHVRIIIELFGEVDHSISCVLLVAISACSQEASESLLRNWIALLCTSGSELLSRHQ